jgi:WD40 repeat protein
MNIQDSPILSYTCLDRRFIVCGSMSGRTVVYDVWSEQVIAERRDHTKYVVKVAAFRTQTGSTLLATAGWDGKVFMYLIRLTDKHVPGLDGPRRTLELPTNPEDLLFANDPRGSNPFLVVTRRDSTFLHYYALQPDLYRLAQPHGPAAGTLNLSGRQNLAPHSNAWVAFTPSALAMCPTDHSLVAVATSTVPHMKLLIARLLFPDEATAASPTSADRIPTAVVQSSRPGLSHPTDVGRAQAEVAREESEASAILVHCNTFASQTQYSTPGLAWRPDGSGVWVTSDDGIIRGIETSTGKIIVSLGGHAAGSKIRCVWAGSVQHESDVEEPDHQECVVTGGFDRELILWRCELPAP